MHALFDKFVLVWHLLNQKIGSFGLNSQYMNNWFIFDKKNVSGVFFDTKISISVYKIHILVQTLKNDHLIFIYSKNKWHLI